MLGPCELHWKNNYTIDPDGKVYKCPAVAGRPEMAVADVNRSTRPLDAGPGSPPPSSEELAAPLLALRPWEKCGDCPYMPVCVGGCLGSKWLKTGRTDEVHCQTEAYEISFRESVKRRYLAEFEPRSGAQDAAA